MLQHIAYLICGALAGGLGWGIRGQYGHETGAMMAGLLVSCVIAVGYLRHLPGLVVARAMAYMTIGIGLGGTMTYGQTVGLTHDQPLVGNWQALQWGMLGLAIKGAIWIGFAGMFFGHALGGRRYHAWGMIGIVTCMFALRTFGIWLINEPYDPAHRILPAIYFSDDWHWEPDSDLKPRREVWGGLAMALIMVAVWLRFIRGDRFAWRMTGFGMLGGGLGFPAGQSFQAYHAWNREAFRDGVWQWLDPLMNWWNVMETTFGCVLGTCLVLGVILNRRLISGLDVADAVTVIDEQETARPQFTIAPETEDRTPHRLAGSSSLAIEICEWSTVAIHIAFLVLADFGPYRWISSNYGDGLTLAALPLVAVSVGRVWPYMLLLPVTLVPIAAKTFRQMVIKEPTVDATTGAILFLVVPIMLAVVLAWYWSRRERSERTAQTFAHGLLAFAACIYFGLNFAFFQFPFPWQTWTPRTPNAIFYMLALVALLVLSAIAARRRTDSHSSVGK